MKRSRTIIAGLAVAAVVGVGAVTAAAATDSHSSGAPVARPAPAASPAAGPTVRTTLATVGGRTETILVNAQGLPLYYYRPDTATSSLVTGGLARLWPPLISNAPSARVTGKITVVNDSHGHQVAYNGHLLYTFIYDTAGKVTGQGVQNFFVATPGLAALINSSAPAPTSSRAPYGGYGY